MVQWTPKRRENLVKLLTNASTVLLATLILGNLVTAKPFNVGTFTVGLGLYAAVVVTVFVLEK